MRVTFEELKFSAQKTTTCTWCTRKVRRSRTFSQTLNPFNQKADGTIKNAEDIRKELFAEADEWQKEPELCTSCR